ncbi:dihydrodipicolinate synthase family protein [Propionivibrio soli]|uniref:dihydrodipicolinate synthase family protein n=1 Tax=Propionivibrio soli TaxID=2976531 RepID=UPI0021E85E50|nr:dihydrodipicolinate synthase family protein [Propionivibrio soli]
MQKTAIHGVNAIVAMPFKDDGSVDYPGFDRVLDFMARSGINGATLFGIASEFHKLAEAEKERLAQRFLGGLAGCGVYRVLSITDHATELAVRRARDYQDSGVDALMLLPPFFLAPSTGQILDHVFAVLDAVSIPVFVQYAPTETGLPVTPEKMAEIAARYPHAVFKIECNPPVGYTQQFLSLVPEAVVMNGYAGLYMLDMLGVGGKGVMPGCSFGEIYSAIYARWLAGDHKSASELHSALLPYIRRWMSRAEYIIQVEKTLLQRRGIIASAYCRKPGYALPDDESEVIGRFLAEFSSFLPQYG